MKILKTILSILAIPFGVKSKLTDEMANEGVINLGGQGKNENGR